MDRQKIKINKRARRKHRVRARVFGTAKRPRFSVFRSLRFIYAQLINDESGKTLVSASENDEEITEITEIEKLSDKKPEKVGIAYALGELIAKRAKKKGVGQVVFDRGGYKYHGRVKAVADGARRGGLKF